MNVAYSSGPWADLFVMAGGACAAFAGLIFVALSVNHQLVLASKTLPLVAVRTLVVLVGAVAMCTLSLAPEQPPSRLGVEQVILGGVVACVVLASTWRSNHGPLRDQLDDWIVGAAATAPVLLGGVSLTTGTGGGMYWLMAEIVTALGAATYYAWFLLIEIRQGTGE